MASVWFFVVQLALLLLVSGFKVRLRDGMGMVISLAICRILSEDKAMVEQLRPDMLAREISVKADLPQIAFRKLRQEYIDMGYGTLPEATDNTRFRSDQ